MAAERANISERTSEENSDSHSSRGDDTSLGGIALQHDSASDTTLLCSNFGRDNQGFDASVTGSIPSQTTSCASNGIDTSSISSYVQDDFYEESSDDEDDEMIYEDCGGDIFAISLSLADVASKSMLTLDTACNAKDPKSLLPTECQGDASISDRDGTPLTDVPRRNIQRASMA